LFDFTHIRAELPKNAPVKVICCVDCSNLSESFTRYHPDGTWEWLAPSAPRKRSYEFTYELRYVACEQAACPPFAGENIFQINDATAIGGVPTWLQDSEYPRCPSCAERMTFLAQHDNLAVCEEGTYYAFFCPTCRIAAVSCQQT
jgi:hypothetical protein